MTKVLVTGGSGFVASHAILKLLNGGYDVATTVRNLARERDVREMLSHGGQQPGDRLSFFEADLVQDRGWDRAVAGCDYVLHVAAPFPPGAPQDENELIVPARDGTVRVLRAARDAGVKRVVATSSFAAIGYGHRQTGKTFTEEDWTELGGSEVAPYIKAKTIAERAAWDFVGREGGTLALTVINPVGVFGPVLGPDFSSSIAIVKRLLEGMPAVPRLYFGIVDVRDLADLHVRAMTADAARGERFLAVGDGVVSMHDVAKMLRAHLGATAPHVPAKQFPDWLLRLLARFKPELRATLPQLGVIRRSSSDKARRVLGWTPRPYAETIGDTADSLIRYNAVKLT